MTDDYRAKRKGEPLCLGVLDYFPDALSAVARLSKHANEIHNPGEPMHWSRGKSADHADCLLRHLRDRGQLDEETGMSHTVAVAWRALALLQLELEAEGAPVARGARVHEDPLKELTRLTEEFGGYEAQEPNLHWGYQNGYHTGRTREGELWATVQKLWDGMVVSLSPMSNSSHTTLEAAKALVEAEYRSCP